MLYIGVYIIGTTLTLLAIALCAYLLPGLPLIITGCLAVLVIGVLAQFYIAKRLIVVGKKTRDHIFQILKKMTR